MCAIPIFQPNRGKFEAETGSMKATKIGAEAWIKAIRFLQVSTPQTKPPNLQLFAKRLLSSLHATSITCRPLNV